MKNICFHLNRKLWLTLVMVLSVTLPALAQKITVHGYVDDEFGEALIGATVMEKGTSNGTSTDIDGNFTLNVAPDATLVVSYVGYDPMEVAVNGQTNIKITMKENAATQLTEAVVIGYGSVKKSDATGSVSVIKPDEIDAGISTSAQDLLVGASPGVVVTTDGGNPTGGATIRIRGGSSLSATNDPLIVIDGVPMTNQGQGGGMSALTMVNPNDIESMTVLKDASATAIYGSRASNGVIIITTKKGKAGKPVVNISANMTVNTARKTFNLMNGPEFANWVTNHLSESSIAQLGYGGEIYNTDWQKEVLRTTISQDYTASIAGKAGFLPYRVNAGYTNSEGILKTSNMQRVTAGFSLSPKFFNDLLSVNVNVNGTYGRVHNADTGAIGGAVGFDPTKPIRTNIPMAGNTGLYLYNGFYNYAPGGIYDTQGGKNPVQLLDDVNSMNNTWSSSGNLQIDYALHFLPDLHLNLNLGYQVSKNDAKSVTAANSVMAWDNGDLAKMDAAGASTLYKWHEIQRNTLLDFYINYKKEFEAIKSNLDVMVGYSWQKFTYFGHSQNYVNSRGFVNQDGGNGFTYDSANNSYFMNVNSAVDNTGAVVNNNPLSQWGNPLQLVSFFGRLNYIFDDTYLLTFTLRDDGTSRFSKDSRWGLFPSVALGWKINNVGKLKDVDWLDEFKLRLGWGQTGQQDIGSYFPYMPIYTNSTAAGFQYPGYSGGWVNPLYPQPFDPEIKWETTTTWNAGIDLGFFNNRLTAIIDYYLRDTKDLLAYTPALGMNTSNYLTTNIGTLRNYGIEVTLGGRPVQTEDFTWNTSVNVGWNHNEITALTGDANTDRIKATGLPVGTGSTLQWHLVGEPAFTYLVYQQVYDADGNPIPGQYVDQNADGEINDDDLIKFHNPDPKVTLTWNNNFSYKNWDLSFALRANIGNYVYNTPRYNRTNSATVDAYGLHNLLKDEYIFTGPTDPLSDYYVENASFLRCDNITLGYTWPNLINDNLRLRLYGAVQNPFVITKYKGLDPEVSGGVDNNVYPRPVSFPIGLIATF